MTLEAEVKAMSVLVTYASRHGSTGEIADGIAQTLRAAGRRASARPVEEVGDLSAYQGFVVGSAVYSNHWLTDAAAFVRSNQELLLLQPVWLFSSGPLGAQATDSQGLDLCTACEPKELCELQEAIHPRGHHVFFGALVPGRLSVAELSLRELAYTRARLPAGDFRDWAQIQEWAERIALELAQCDATQEKDRLPADKKPIRTLTAADLCDRCSAPAVVETVQLQGGSLLWCGQHYALVKGALWAMGATVVVDKRPRWRWLARPK
jgi:menaquinone-dependent protoporphyrinogen oxidase